MQMLLSHGSSFCFDEQIFILPFQPSIGEYLYYLDPRITMDMANL
jgi:hypothetical protein